MAQTDQDPSSTGDQKDEGGLSGIAGACRPLVKELVKAGLVAFETASVAASGIGKQFNDLVEEARAETVKAPSPDPSPAETERKDRGSRSEKVKGANGKSS